MSYVNFSNIKFSEIFNKDVKLNLMQFCSLHLLKYIYCFLVLCAVVT